MPRPELTEHPPSVSRGAWWRWGLSGLLGSALLLGIAHVTHNDALLPAFLLAANGTVPAALILWLAGRVGTGRVGAAGLATAFAATAVVGLAVAAVVESEVALRGPWGPAYAAGIEETVKLACVAAVAWPWLRSGGVTLAEGLMLGVAAGAGFAVFESNGFAFEAFLQGRDTLSGPVHETLLRGALSPMGHTAWSGVAAATVLGRWHPVRGVAAALGLHAAWDAFPRVAATLVGETPPSYVTALILASTVGMVGLYALRVVVRRATHDAPAASWRAVDRLA